jgi:amidohydrolase
MDATMQVGKVGLRSGPLMAAGDAFTITVTGKGGHGAFPEVAIDAVAIGAQVVQAIHQIVSRRVSATDPAIISLGSFQSSSTRGNVISERVILEGTIRTFNKEVRKTIMAELERACSIARVLGGEYSITYEEGYPVVINDPEVTKVMWDTACDIVGPENVIELTPKCWSEDFSMFQEVIPGSFMFLGARIDGDERMHHTDRFDLNEQGFYLGTAILAETARRLIPHMEKLK